MTTIELTSGALTGTVSAQVSADADGTTLCVIDLAPRTLGTQVSALPRTLVRGTITYVLDGLGRCSALEHTVVVANGDKITNEAMVELTKGLQHIAEELLATVQLPAAPRVQPVVAIPALATVHQIDRRAYA